MPIKTAVFGAHGKMGQRLCAQLSSSEDFELVFGVDRMPLKIAQDFPVYDDPNCYEGKLDLIIDFSHVSNIDSLLKYAIFKKTPVMIATTGLDESHYTKMKDASQQVPLLYAANMSLGVNLINSILKQYAHVLSDGFDIEIIEKHHRHKQDAPSGTALLLANTLKDALEDDYQLKCGREGAQSLRQPHDIGVHAVRGGSISGEHTVLFAGEQELIEFKHTALSKDLFAHDALRIARKLVHKPAGYYTVAELFHL